MKLRILCLFVLVASALNVSAFQGTPPFDSIHEFKEMPNVAGFVKWDESFPGCDMDASGGTRPELS